MRMKRRLGNIYYLNFPTERLFHPFSHFSIQLRATISSLHSPHYLFLHPMHRKLTHLLTFDPPNLYHLFRSPRSAYTSCDSFSFLTPNFLSAIASLLLHVNIAAKSVRPQIDVVVTRKNPCILYTLVEDTRASSHLQ